MSNNGLFSWFGFVSRYTRWLHTQWPAGGVEKLPEVRDDGSTNVPGLYVAGDLAGIPLLKFSVDSGARVVQAILNDPQFTIRSDSDPDLLDLAVIGGGVSGFSAAVEAQKSGLDFKIFESTTPFSTIVNLPKAKPIFTYPTQMTPAGQLRFHEKSSIKEGLLEDLKDQTLAQGIEPVMIGVDRVRRRGQFLELMMQSGGLVRAQRVIVAIGCSGNFRKLGVEGEDRDKIYNRLHDPTEFCNCHVMVVGGGDSALETAIALATCGAHVTLSYRKGEFSRPKPENVVTLNSLVVDPTVSGHLEQFTRDRIAPTLGDDSSTKSHFGQLRLMMSSQLKRIGDKDIVVTDANGQDQTIANDFVFAMTGREAPLDFFRRSGIRITGEWGRRSVLGFIAFMLFMIWVYHWKAAKAIPVLGPLPDAQNPDPASALAWLESLSALGARFLNDPTTLLGTLKISMSAPAFYYTLAYTAIVIVFGIRRIRRRRTPYIRLQTLTLMAIQSLPLFILPEIVLPLAGHKGLFGPKQQVMGFDKAAQERWQLVGEVLQAKTQSQIGFKTEQRLGDQDIAVTNRITPRQLQERVDLLVAGMPDLPPAVLNWNREVHLKRPGIVVEDRSGSGCIAVDIRGKRLYLTDLTQVPTWRGHLGDALFPVASYGNGREYWRAYGFVLAWPLMVYNWFTDEPLWFWLVIGFFQTFVIIPLLIYQFGKGAYCGWICSCGAMAETLGDTHRHKMPHGPIWNRLNMIGQAVLLFAVVLMALRIGGWLGIGWATSLFEIGFTKIPILNFQWFIDVLLAGILGYGLYFWYSGRMWCRFACPLAALMHLYTRFSRFGIISEKKKCISCNVCTSVCHQGIDVMSFANKGWAMQDPQCVRCSACVQSCPTGVLQFGRIDRQGHVLGYDRLRASPVRVAEVPLTIDGK